MRWCMPQLLGMARCVASLCRMHVRRLRLPLPRLGRLPLLGRCKRAWQAVPTPVEPCVRGTASGSVRASHVGSVMHCVLGTRGAVASASIAAASACNVVPRPPSMLADSSCRMPAAPYSRLMRLGAHAALLPHFTLCSARSAGRRSTRHRRSIRTSGAGMWDE